MHAKHFSGIFLIVFVAAAAIMTGLFLPAASSKTGAPNLRDIVQGKWAVTFEKKLGEVLPVYEPSRNIWGRLDYTLFHQGRKGVIVGNDGWLFTDEEFSCPPRYAENTNTNLAYINTVRDTLKEKGTALAVVLVPAKARIYSDKLGTHTVPRCRHDLYSTSLSALTAAAIPAVDLLSAMNNHADKNSLYLKTDTHWSPSGAKLAADTTASTLKNTAIRHDTFSTVAGESATHNGDLMRYIPGVGTPAITPDPLPAFTTTGAAGTDLFSDNTPDVTLVGTSYSANPLWNFEGFLKDSLQADILNMADEGLGPFAVMQTYLANEAWKNTPPKLLIWEIPERYIMTPPNHRINQ